MYAVRIIEIIFILIFAACSSPVDQSDNSISKDSSPTEFKSHKPVWQDTVRISGEREYIDSAHFHIIRGKYVSGAKYIEAYQDSLTRLDHWKEYYGNGQLKEEGLMTTGNHIYIGAWKYYSSDGKQDSVIDYDRKYYISYYEALEIAEHKGYHMPGIEVSLKVDSDKTYWEIVRWSENENGRSGDAILIDTKTGNVTKPDLLPMAIY